MKKLLAFAVTALFAVSLTAGEYPDISIKELKTHIAKKKVTVIDVMGGSSYKKGHVPSAISFAQHGKNLAKVLPKDKNALVVAYCGGPSCKAYKRAADLAAKLGYTNVKHMSAGISGWKKAGEKTEKAN
ncbi:uncharacterized protein METZ01_LOCUS469059 [marine metagenome]|uniref:Rhodanese domain-containing protein n=1 Tax=marine metagenome TaxID=408172 RepID=A0A383B9V3_9ZZZZ